MSEEMIKLFESCKGRKKLRNVVCVIWILAMLWRKKLDPHKKVVNL